MQRRSAICGCLLLLASWARAQTRLASSVREFVKVDAATVALTHVRVIDGTEAAPLEDQTVVVGNGKIQAIGQIGGQTTGALPEGTKTLDLAGYTVIPGLIGMHDHLFYPSGRRAGLYLLNELAFSAPRLYLACGVTTIRTTGSIEPFTDLSLKKLIDEGKIPGPKIHITGPYLQGPGALPPLFHELTGSEDARQMVDYWAEAGATSFKAYTTITHAELAAAIEAAHRRGLKITGHLCSVGFREAAALGIDDLEHGLLVDSEFVPGKAPDVCPPSEAVDESLATLDLDGAPAREMIRDLVAKHVAVTSTLAVFETEVPNRPSIELRILDALLPQARIDYLLGRARIAERKNDFGLEFKKELDFERAFVKSGGLLMAGADPTGYGGVLPGFADQREVELLVEAGFSPVEAIHVATSNGAEWLGESTRIGTLEVGKQADLIVIHGDPTRDISDIEKVEMVFKDGIGYDSQKLIESVRGEVGLH